MADSQTIDLDLAAMSDIVELPAGCMPLDGVMVIQYLDEDGETRLMFKSTDSYHSHTIGMLNMAAWQIMHISNHEEEDLNGDS